VRLNPIFSPESGGDTTVVMKIKNDGEITWTPSGIYKTHCETDVTFYPFDTQECDVIVTSWGYTSIELSLYVDTEAVRLSYFKENGEWEYLSLQNLVVI
jgi:hypothetical protein